jgi:hypothetical protein
VTGLELGERRSHVVQRVGALNRNEKVARGIASASSARVAALAAAAPPSNLTPYF